MPTLNIEGTRANLAEVRRQIAEEEARPEPSARLLARLRRHAGKLEREIKAVSLVLGVRE